MTTVAPAELTGLITQILHVDAGTVTREASLADLGLDSGGELELLIAVEDHYRITVDFGVFADLDTVGELADAITCATENGSLTG
jgi:acyl carrier protein